MNCWSCFLKIALLNLTLIYHQRLWSCFLKIALLNLTSDHQLCLCPSEFSVLGVESNLSMKFMGNIHGKEVLILLDSDSSATFLSSYVTVEVPGQVQLVQPLNIRVANGTRIQCHTHSTS
jgi:hypothetical protein